MKSVSIVFKNIRHLIEWKNIVPISDTRKKSIVSADLRPGMKGKCQKVFFNSLIEENKKITQLFNFSIFSYIKSYSDVLILKEST